jgi:hypothetical protein
MLGKNTAASIWVCTDSNTNSAVHLSPADIFSSLWRGFLTAFLACGRQTLKSVVFF